MLSLGHAWGAWVAAMHAIRHPAEVCALVLCSLAGWFPITPEGQAFLDENRGFVKAIFARVSRSGRERGSHCGRDIKHSLHALKATVVAKVRGETLSEQQLQKIQAILERAAEDVQKVE